MVFEPQRREALTDARWNAEAARAAAAATGARLEARVAELEAQLAVGKREPRGSNGATA